MKPALRASFLNIAANTFLFVIKLAGGLLTGSLALLSDAMNSASDMIYSTAIIFAVRISNKAADKDHPFGHRRAEPIAGILVAILAGILGFEIIKAGIDGLMNPGVITMGYLAVVVLLVTICLKIGMWLYFKKVGAKFLSPAIRACSVDSRNDVLVSAIALLGVLGSMSGLSSLSAMDDIAAVLIGAFIIWSGYKIGAENIDFLMGKSPGEEMIARIKEKALSVKGVRGLNEVKAHYVGNFVHVEVHIEVDKDMSTQKSHDLGKKVEMEVERLHGIDKAFVHVDPV